MQLRHVLLFPYECPLRETFFKPLLSDNLHVVWVPDYLRRRQLTLLELFVVVFNGLPLKQQHVLLQLRCILTRHDVRGERRDYLVGDRRAKQTRQVRTLLVKVVVVDGYHTVLQDKVLVTGLARHGLYQFWEGLRLTRVWHSFRDWRLVEHWPIPLSVNLE